MREIDIKNYIGALLQEPEPDEKIMEEVPNMILLLSVYMAGLQKKDFPIHNLYSKLDLEKEISASFHTLVAQGAILKSNKGNNRAMDYLNQNVRKLLKDFTSYVTNQLK